MAITHLGDLQELPSKAQLFSEPGNKREPFLRKTVFSGAATQKKRGTRGATELPSKGKAETRSRRAIRILIDVDLVGRGVPVGEGAPASAKVDHLRKRPLGKKKHVQ